jgi:hypothetical protein
MTTNTIEMLRRLNAAASKEEIPLTDLLESLLGKGMAWRNNVSALDNRRKGDISFRFADAHPGKYFSLEDCGVLPGRTNFSVGVAKVNDYVGYMCAEATQVSDFVLDISLKHSYYLFWCHDYQNEGEKIVVIVRADKLRKYVAALIPNPGEKGGWYKIKPSDLAAAGIIEVAATTREEAVRELVQKLQA